MSWLFFFCLGICVYSFYSVWVCVFICFFFCLGLCVYWFPLFWCMCWLFFLFRIKCLLISSVWVYILIGFFLFGIMCLLISSTIKRYTIKTRKHTINTHQSRTNNTHITEIQNKQCTHYIYIYHKTKNNSHIHQNRQIEKHNKYIHQNNKHIYPNRKKNNQDIHPNRKSINT
jgi:hypothetical protein